MNSSNSFSREDFLSAKSLLENLSQCFRDEHLILESDPKKYQETIANWTKYIIVKFDADTITRAFGEYFRNERRVQLNIFFQYCVKNNPLYESEVTAYKHAAIEWVNRKYNITENWKSNRHFWAASLAGDHIMCATTYKSVEKEWVEYWRLAKKYMHQPIPEKPKPENSLPNKTATQNRQAFLKAMAQCKQALKLAKKAAAQ